MFTNTIDNKPKYVDDDGIELKDLGESIFTSKAIYNSIGYTVYRVSKNLEMRPDLISRAAYNDEDNTEMLLKYNNIQNPFTIKEDDILIFPSGTQINTYVGTPIDVQKENDDALIRQFHKYVDKNKKPDTIGSEKNNQEIKKSENLSALNGNGSGNGNNGLTGNTATRFKEANLASIGATSIKEINGKLYFGADTGMKCAANGVSTSEYLKEVIKNSTDNK